MTHSYRRADPVPGFLATCRVYGWEDRGRGGYCVGSPEVDEMAYELTPDQVGKSDATELVNLTILLDNSTSYPFGRFKELNTRFAAENYFAQNSGDVPALVP